VIICGNWERRVDEGVTFSRERYAQVLSWEWTVMSTVQEVRPEDECAEDMIIDLKIGVLRPDVVKLQWSSRTVLGVKVTESKEETQRQ
jgi:hypothetical protein